jgi:hypothetical protein
MTRPLEQAVAAIVCTFQEYAGRCGDKYKICQSELKELLQKELPTWTPVSTSYLSPLGLCKSWPRAKQQHRVAHELRHRAGKGD